MTSSIPPGYTKREYIKIGDDFQLTVTFSSIPANQSIIQAWFSVKESLSDANPLLQKTITPILVAGVGQIVDTGATSEHATVHFEGPPSDFANLLPGVAYLYDVQVESSAGKRETIERGTIYAQPQITTA